MTRPWTPTACITTPKTAAPPHPGPAARALHLLGRRSFRRGLVSFLVLIAAWEIVGRFFLTDRVFAVPFSAVVEAAWAMWNRGELQTNIAASLTAVAYGTVLAAVCGILIGVLLGASTTFREYVEPLFTALYATPLVAMAPILILWFGIGIGSKIAVVFLMAIFPIAINTATGIRSTDREYLEVAKSFGASKRRLITKVMIPAAVPFVVTGLRLAVGKAIVGVVVGELFGARAGLGFLIFTAGQTFDTPGLFVGVITLALIGMFLTMGIRAIEDRLPGWKAQEQEQE
jgi:ABC-type nitrate/sulfonate/bicarbonate transport system permease component